MTRPTKSYLDEIRKLNQDALQSDSAWTADIVSALFEEIDALNANQCTGCCYQAESVDCELRELAERRVTSTTLRHEFKMLQAGAKRHRDALRAAQHALISIASTGKPRHSTEEYWLSIAHASCASVLATDTEIARKTVDQINKVLGERG